MGGRDMNQSIEVRVGHTSSISEADRQPALLEERPTLLIYSTKQMKLEATIRFL